MSSNKSSTLIKVFFKFVTASLFMVHLNSYAVEPFFQVHKVDQSGAYGVNIGVGDNFFNQQEFNWAASYSRIEDVNVTWAGQDINFSLDTIDLTLSYRYYPKSYNTFIKSLIFEFQAGVGIAITENKFVFRPNLDTDDVYFSEQGDVNVTLAFLVHKKINKELSMQIGIKSYPDYSEFGDVSSLFLGFSYQFGGQGGY